MQNCIFLQTIVTIYFTDDRYATDVHYQGGCVLASEMLSWASIMFAWNARPPSPYNIPDWKEQWLNRLHNASGRTFRSVKFQHIVFLSCNIHSLTTYTFRST